MKNTKANILSYKNVDIPEGFGIYRHLLSSVPEKYSDILRDIEEFARLHARLESRGVFINIVGTTVSIKGGDILLKKPGYRNHPPEQ